MQLYAYDQFDRLHFSKQAEKQRDYFCPECRSVVRLREGIFRKPHFYHLKNAIHCRQSGKSLNHLQLQLYFKSRLPEGEALLEHRFPEIQRIADVAWIPKNLIFEIQCSPLTKDEMQARNAAYESVGFRVIWILHDIRYNKWRMSSLEMGLIGLPHYFSNINDEGKGMIYDQFSLIEKGVRKHLLPPLPVDITAPYEKKDGRIGFSGDLNSLGDEHPYRLKIFESKIKLEKRPKKDRFAMIISRFNRFFESLLKKYAH